MGDRRITIEELIQIGIDSATKELHTALPGVIETFYPDKQLADIQVTIKRKLGDELVNLPKLVEVPVCYPKTSNFSITFPLSEGDHVLLIFAERSIDTWLQDGGIQAPYESRTHSLSDAFAIPILFPQNDVISSFNTNAIEIRSDDRAAFISINLGNKIRLKTDNDVQIECVNLDATLSGDLTIDCVNAIVNASGDTTVDCANAIITTDTDLTATVGGKAVIEATGNIEAKATGDLKGEGLNVEVKGTTKIDAIAPTVNITAPVVNVSGVLTCAGLVTGALTYTGTAPISIPVDLQMGSGKVIKGDTVFGSADSNTHIHSQGTDSDGDIEVDTGGPHL